MQSTASYMAWLRFTRYRSSACKVHVLLHCMQAMQRDLLLPAGGLCPQRPSVGEHCMHSPASPLPAGPGAVREARCARLQIEHMEQWHAAGWSLHHGV